MKRHHGNESTGAGLLISKQACLKERNKKKYYLVFMETKMENHCICSTPLTSVFPSPTGGVGGVDHEN